MREDVWYYIKYKNIQFVRNHSLKLFIRKAHKDDITKKIGTEQDYNGIHHIQLEENGREAIGNC